MVELSGPEDRGIDNAALVGMRTVDIEDDEQPSPL